jgi:predicted adenylyl cyclase CyaB
LPVNIEIKSRIDDFELVRQRIEALTDSVPEIIYQRDTFYRTKSGRLKLRHFDGGSAELIYYDRSDMSGASKSTYQRVRIPQPAETHEIMKKLLDVRGVVEKTRMLYFFGQTRIHLDQVQHLGDFIELEVVLKAEQSEQEGIHIAGDICEKLDIREENFVDVAYIDLLERKYTSH